MLVGTHNKIASFVYNNVVARYTPYSFLNKTMFKAGNMLPDISFSLSKIDHTREGASTTCFEHLIKSQYNDLTLSERLINLGVASHFLSDFFCIYHIEKSHIEAHIVPHLIYEFKIHMLLLYFLINKKKLNEHLSKIELPVVDKNPCHNLSIKDIKKLSTEKNDFTLYESSHEIKEIKENLVCLQNKYAKSSQGVNTDIIYALKAVMTVSDILTRDMEIVHKPAIIINFTLKLRRFSSIIASNLKLIHYKVFPAMIKSYI